MIVICLRGGRTCIRDEHGRDLGSLLNEIGIDVEKIKLTAKVHEISATLEVALHDCKIEVPDEWVDIKKVLDVPKLKEQEVRGGVTT